MHEERIKVLLLGETGDSSSRLRSLLESRGCTCRFARSVNEGVALYGKHSFHLILSATQSRQLIEMGDSTCAIFSAFRVEDSHWWVPIARHGKDCFGDLAIRPREFNQVLDEVLKETGAENALDPAPES